MTEPSTWPVSKPRLLNLVRLLRPETVCSCRAATCSQTETQVTASAKISIVLVT